MLKSFVGFKGISAFVQIGEIKFMIIAKNARQLETLWHGILIKAGPFDPTKCKKAILIEAKNLPDSRVSLTPGFSQVATEGPNPKTVFPT